jgi:hypothetical protein
LSGDIFVPADILLPKAADMTKWSVIACDQFSSDLGYWERVRRFTAGAPTTLDMIVPEAYLGHAGAEPSAASVRARMLEYLRGGVFETVRDSMVYLERTISGGAVRRGIVGAIDLETYDFEPGASAPVRASERTVKERLPARLDVRRHAPLELPHVLAFIADRDRRVIERFSDKTGALELLYDFELMEGGGRVRGWRVAGDDARAVTREIGTLERDGGGAPAMMIGDGNHSLAAAKLYWDEIKRGASENAPARYALAEINNIYDDAIAVHAIHRAVLGADTEALLDALKKALPPSAPDGAAFRWVHARGEGALSPRVGGSGELFERLQDFLDGYTEKNGCEMDYIHGEGAVRALAARDGVLGIIMPAMQKQDVFETVARHGCLPKKSFSVGRARDKRYYLECRAIGG